MRIPTIPTLDGIDQNTQRVLQAIKAVIEVREGRLAENSGERFIRLSEFEAVPNWNDADLINSWVNYGTPYANAGYNRDRGMVFLRGAIKTGTVGTVAFILPVGFRPKFTVLAAVCSNAGFGQVTVAATGEVTPITPSSNVIVSLDTVRFSYY